MLRFDLKIEARAFWKFYNHYHEEAVATGRQVLRLNLDDTSVAVFQNPAGSGHEHRQANAAGYPVETGRDAFESTYESDVRSHHQ